MINSNSFDDNNDIINQQNDYKLIDKIDQRLIDLLIKGYTNKSIRSGVSAKYDTKTNKKDIWKWIYS